MAGEELQELKATFDAGEFHSGSGTITEMPEFEEQVLQIIVENAGMPQRSIRIAIDCGNAVPGPLTVSLMQKLGVALVPIHCDWNNTFPNHPPDPTRQKNMVDLSKAVVENNCEFGIGMDGDGDRIGVVDEKGRFIHPDRLMAVIAADVLVDRRDGTEAERTVFFDVKCSMALEEAILASGGVPKMVRTGHSFMKRELRSNPEAVMAGEMSGHFFLHDRWPGFDCSLYNAARLLEIVGRDPSPKDGGMSFSQRFANLPDYPSTDETKIPLVAGRQETMAAVEGAFADMEKSTVDGIRVRYPDGWYLCRPSNTEPVLVMRAEGRDNSALAAIIEDVNSRIGHMLDLNKLR